MSFRLDPTSPQPIYRQIVDQVQSRVATGDLEQGQKLPSVRDLAMELRINPNTVARAYRELESEGIVVLQQGRGVFVAPRKSVLPFTQRRKQLEGPVTDLLVAAWKLNVDVQQLIELLQEKAQEMQQGSAGSQR